MAQFIQQVGYGLSDALPVLAPKPIIANRAPLSSDKYPLGQIWVFKASNIAYMLLSVVNNSATWLQLQSAGAAGAFSSLVVTGPSTLVGTSLINSTGTASTTIGNSTAASSVDIIAGATGGIELSAGGNIVMVPATATIASPASTTTINANVFKVTCTGFTTANAGGLETFTITNNKVSTSSFVNYSVSSLDASTNGALLTVTGCVLSANTITITVANNGAGALGAGDDILLAFVVNS